MYKCLQQILDVKRARYMYATFYPLIGPDSVIMLTFDTKIILQKSKYLMCMINILFTHKFGVY